jgi:hypothetical protein
MFHVERWNTWNKVETARLTARRQLVLGRILVPGVVWDAKKGLFCPRMCSTRNKMEQAIR